MDPAGFASIFDSNVDKNVLFFPNKPQLKIKHNKGTVKHKIVRDIGRMTIGFI